MRQRSGDLFSGEPGAPAAPAAARAPLAERLRPRTPEGVAGQQHLLGEGRFLRRLLDRGEVTSILLWGPPGVGKTTLARMLAEGSGARFVELSATSSGVKEVRETARDAEHMRRHSGQSTVLFIDEIHRFHKGQQDALLPWVENGSLILIGATTENPSFEVVAPLLSRCRLLRLEALTTADLVQLLRRAITAPPPEGLGGTGLEVDDGMLERIAELADGDARAALMTLELAAELAPPGEDGTTRTIHEAAVREAAQKPWLRYGREEHFDHASALQKSIRSSDPDAALYWLARMIDAGEDPKFVARRLIRIASEDVGLAEPRALEMAVAGLAAYEAIGLPEGDLALAQVAVYLAVAPKSDAVYRALAAARGAIESHGNLPVPMQLRNAPTRTMREAGYGSGYRHAHDTPDGVTDMACLPPEFGETVFYAPREDRGIEQRIGERLRKLRQDRVEIRRAGQPTEPSSE